MLQRELTFYCRHPLTICQAQRLRRLGGLFQSRLLLLNLTRRQQANPAQPLTVLALGVCPGDLCQLVIEGCDAELAHLVLTSWVNEQGALLGPRPTDHDEIDRRLSQHLPDYHFPPARPDRLKRADKQECLQQLVNQLPDSRLRDPAQLMRHLLTREQVCATVMRPGLAMPHVMSSSVLAPCLDMVYSPTPLEWQSSLGPVQLVILLALPERSHEEHLRPLSHLVRALLDDRFCPALLRASTPAARRAILLEGLIPAGTNHDIGTASAPSSV
ncbi:PTS sugar transporter subunit IIA [Aeromonas simiae]|uniref:PTS sugar transporter subunit IIA n=1 Tax=Aeromonas simiae TaxID=218936 RepID=UPI0005A79FA4|nr:PTS sugar transporter subunit IIA [Aeromonas simiae]MDO2949360.1 PTS sugar transporter subunit IIA [Aeromonas simiae]MDO2952939.1 PTS sugar transporter subunit IIA [Aeromonas simiae]MDO2956634.1 PTS sugar transporter subunit IIA [Aeromonas simiae]